MKTHFEIIDNKYPKHSDGLYPFAIIQRKRTVYYEDVVNPSKYRDMTTCVVKTKEVAELLCKIFNENLFTSEWLEKNGYFTNTDWTKVRNGSGRGEWNMYKSSESLVKYETDLYNGTDQSMRFEQIMKLPKTGKYSSSSKYETICRFWDSNYVPVVINKWSKLTKKTIL